MKSVRKSTKASLPVKGKPSDLYTQYGKKGPAEDGGVSAVSIDQMFGAKDSPDGGAEWNAFETALGADDDGGRASSSPPSGGASAASSARSAGSGSSASTSSRANGSGGGSSGARGGTSSRPSSTDSSGTRVSERKQGSDRSPPGSPPGSPPTSPKLGLGSQSPSERRSGGKSKAAAAASAASSLLKRLSGGKKKSDPASNAYSSGAASCGGDSFELDLDNVSTGTSMSNKSAAEYEDVFGRRMLDVDGLDGEFEFSNPAKWRDDAATKEAVFDVLAKGGSTMQMARKLFLIEQMNRPSAPANPPNYWSRQSMFGGKSRRKKTKGFYEIPSGESGSRPEMFWTVAELVSSGLARDAAMLGWAAKVDVLLECSKLVGKLHQGGWAHGSLRGAELLLDDGLHAHLRASKSIAPLSKEEARGEGKVSKLQLDVFGLGLVALELCTGRQLADLQAPKLRNAIKLEESRKNEALEEGARDVDAEVRGLLQGCGTPSSLLELAAQCLSSLRISRPTADDMIPWLQDLRHEMNDASTPATSTIGAELVRAGRLALKAVPDFDLSIIPVLGDEDGYETDDSFAPPDMVKASSAGSGAPGGAAGKPPRPSSAKPGSPPSPPPKDAKRSTGNSLQAFLAAGADAPDRHGGGDDAKSYGDAPSRASAGAGTGTGAGERRSRPKSGQLQDGLDASAAGGEQGAPGERRRSLDRGYYYAKQKMEEIDHAERKQLLSRANIAKLKQEVMAAQVKVSEHPIDPEGLALRLDEQELLPADEALAIIKRADTALRAEPNLVKLDAAQSGTVTVVGDIHAQYFDLRNMMRINGQPGKGAGKTAYLFLGDYIDRGDFGCEVLLYLFALKAKYPAHVWLLRGNHEARSVSAFFGFKEECERKYGLSIYNRCCEAFQCMPIAATIVTPAGKFLCVHGGISPNVQTLDQFVEFDRFEEPAMTGFLCDVLWSDPVKDGSEEGQQGGSLSDFLAIDFLPNPQRGCSYRYGFRALVQFLAVNGLVSIIRAHEVCEEGYMYHFQEANGGGANGGALGVIAGKASAPETAPPVITVFSAPNYCGRYGNKAAVMRVHEKPPGKLFKKPKKGAMLQPMQLLEPVQFTAVHSPPPLEFESEQERVAESMTQTIPYMPTTFSAFIRKAIQLGEEDLRRKAAAADNAPRKDNDEPPQAPPRIRGAGPALPERKPKEGDQEPSPPATPPDSASAEASADEHTDDEELQPRKNKKGGKNWKAAQLMGFDSEAGKAAGPGDKGKKPPKPKGKKAGKKFTEAAALDGVNELNPTVVQDKMLEAKSKITPNKLPPSVLIAQQGAESRAAGGSAMRFSLKALPRKDTLSGARPEPGDAGGAQEGDAITFTTSELLHLQMLFLLVDLKDKGFITADDLVKWSAEEGIAVRSSEAEMCIYEVDVDGDGKIGFEDYLVFAAKSKDRWLLEKYESVMARIKEMNLTPEALLKGA